VRIAKSTSSGRLVQLPGLTMGRAARAILTVLPVDDFVADPVRRMEVVGDAAIIPDVQREVQQEIDRACGKHVRLIGVERFAFYNAAMKAFAVVQVGDVRPYGCFLLRKGVIASAA